MEETVVSPDAAPPASSSALVSTMCEPLQIAALLAPTSGGWVSRGDGPGRYPRAGGGGSTTLPLLSMWHEPLV
jgi:hypothetical protein